MKTEKEIKFLISLHERALQLEPYCECEVCFARQAITNVLKWIVNGDSQIDREIENLAQKLNELGG